MNVLTNLRADQELMRNPDAEPCHDGIWHIRIR